ncbi:hypothetical protein D3C84_803330 [compost metagenome]
MSSRSNTPGLTALAMENSTSPLPAMLSWRWKMSISPKRRPLSRMFCSRAGPLKPAGSRQITLITSTSSACGCSLSLTDGAGLVSSGKSSSRLLKLGPPSRSRLRFMSPWEGSPWPRLPRLEPESRDSRAGMLTDGRSCSSSCGSLCVSSTRDGPNSSGLVSSSGRLDRLRSRRNFSFPLPPRIRRQPSKRIPAMTIMPMTISHSRRPISM